jgi:DNA end-binding protein Ku
MLELMHFPEELLDASEFKAPAAKSIRKNEMQMAQQLIGSMSSKWEPSQYSDEYHEALETMIEKKIQSGGKPAPVPAKKKRPTNVVDLMSVLKQSLRERASETKSEKATKKSRAKSRKKAA